MLPLLKKMLLDPDEKKNYRPVSNLAYVGKLIEKVAITRFSKQIKSQDLDEPLQSAYKEAHSVETALVKVLDDLPGLDTNFLTHFPCRASGV